MATNKKKSIILVNDVTNQLRLATVILEKADYKIFPFQRAEDALNFLRNGNTVDAIVTDLHMPEIDGWKFCRLLRSADYAEFNDIPILVISSTFSGADAEEITKDIGTPRKGGWPFA
ncbi:MAG: two-component system response regulator, partial [Calditrichia bacterium]